MDVISESAAPKFHSVGQLSRRATILFDGQVALGKGTYGKGMAAPFHSHKGGEIIHILSGKAVFATRDQEIVASAGMTLHFMPGEEHMLENRWDEPMIMVWIYPEPADAESIKRNWVRIA